MGTIFMTTERAPAFRCIKVGAGFTCLWAAGLAFVLAHGGIQLLDFDEPLGNAILIGSLAALAIGIPVWRDDKFRNPVSVFFLVMGAAAASALLAVVAGFGFFAYILLGWSTNHR